MSIQLPAPGQPSGFASSLRRETLLQDWTHREQDLELGLFSVVSTESELVNLQLDSQKLYTNQKYVIILQRVKAHSASLTTIRATSER